MAHPTCSCAADGRGDHPPGPTIAKSITTTLSTLARCEVVEPGLVLIRNALDIDAQVEAARLAMARGRDGERGFWTNGSELNCSKSCSRGRVFDAIDTFDESLVGLCTAAVHAARAVDLHLPEMVPTHLLMVFYAAGRGIFWHKDNAPNDGQNDHPVVSFSLGNTCTFGVCHNWSWQRGKEAARKMVLHSGDAILFGGRCRYIHHSVLGVTRGSAPPELSAIMGNARLNLTFRDAPGVAGLEGAYQYFEPKSTRKAGKKRARAGGRDEHSSVDGASSNADQTHTEGAVA